ncbi:uncharacterized protein BXZ73DRAFT_98636 [Epithele typhae]|uniref:uncharacterized protein n=1 Tax=Epithele typhae TaxID=378194 RepID=UPI0020086AFE|nr:uncharacterized protein BXZ73DRAFT_98636 [Epithele typhae]KAH9940808.1 hypothetical protein BXZ73DRAFT_98636 [Epithele typhae]
MQAPLERGKACQRCKRRKMRCDGHRPSCSQCVAHSDECEYLDGFGPTQNQLLEEQIAHLQSRIADITAAAAPLTLHDPYAAWHQRNAQRTANDPKRTLVREFALHANEFGFFLHIHRFLDKVYAQSTPSHSLTILLNVIYLLGAKFSNNPQVHSQEQAYLALALQHLPKALPEDPRGAIYVMQAEVLLANYFFNGHRQLEGVYHTNAAVSIAMASKLHMIRSSRRSRSSAEANAYRLPPPADTLEEGERINGFWTVFILDRCWAVATGLAPAITDDDALGTQIDTPWPMDLAMYHSHPFPGDYRTSHTVKVFTSGTDAGAASPGYSVLAMHAKAVILYEMLRDSRPATSPAAFLSLDNRIERFREALPRLDLSRSDTIRTVLLAHTLAQCASIQLHTPFVQDRVTANSRTYHAAHAAVENMKRINASLLCVNPFMGILWGSVAKVISQAISTGHRLRASGTHASARDIPTDEQTLKDEYVRVLATMEQVTTYSPLMGAQLATLRSPRHG